MTCSEKCGSYSFLLDYRDDRFLYQPHYGMIFKKEYFLTVLHINVCFIVTII